MILPIFIVSDVHAFDGGIPGASRPSFFDISHPESGGQDNPISALKNLVVTERIAADYLIVCGDLGDKAHPRAVERVWREMHELKALLAAKEVIATVGNHDVDSRHTHNDHDAKGLLLDLVPGFPFRNEELNNHFWAHHFGCFLDERTGTRFVILNSSAYHGEHDPSKKDAEYVHGRVSGRTLRKLKECLKTGGRAAANVLVCHHHPQKHDEYFLGDYDDMRGGPELIKSLDSAEFGPWVILHGHKHHPKISYAQGGTDSTVVFAAGSCAAILHPDLQGHARNQVHRIELTVDSSNISSTCYGEFQSWDWAPARGWKSAQPGSGLPANGGFGFRGDLGELASAINSQVEIQAMWNEIQQAVPKLRHILPEDLTTLCAFLKNHHGFSIQDGSNGVPIIIQK